VTRVFAVPFNGQCLNVGRVEESQGSTRIVRKRSPDFEVEIWASQICGGGLDYWSLPTVSSVETGLR
jgi:hypothetical protein